MSNNHNKADRNERRRQAINLRKAGRSWAEIAELLGHDSPATAYNDVKRALEQTKTDLKETADDYRQLELDRLDDMLGEAWKVMKASHVVVSGGNVVMIGPEGEERPLTDDGPTLDAIRTLLRIAERRSKFLGLDAPTRVEGEGTLRVVVEGDVDVEGMK
jgi:DNA-binding transcriptional MerR regulator